MLRCQGADRLVLADKKKIITNESKLNLLHTTMHHNTGASENVNLHGIQPQHQPNNSAPGSIQESVPSLPNMGQAQQLSWTCELCGRMFATRDEWTIHAKSHLEVRASPSRSIDRNFEFISNFGRFQY